MPYLNLEDAEAIAKSQELIQVLTPEVQALLDSLSPKLEKLVAASNRHQESYAGLLRGDPEKAKECEANRIEVCQLIAQFHGTAKTCSIVKPEVLKMLGFSTIPERTSSALAPLTQPRDVKITYNDQGQPVVGFTRVVNAKGYQVWISNGDPSIEANWRLFESSSTCRGIVINGLDRANFHWLKVRANRGKTTGPWSAAISIPNS